MTSKFLNELSDLVYKCYDGVASDAPLPDIECTYDRLELIREKLESLGENAKRMLEIGILIDRLNKLKLTNPSFHHLHQVYTFWFNDMAECISFYESYAYYIDRKTKKVSRFYYSSPTWQDDVIKIISLKEIK